ncbi:MULTISPECIES: hypothetical protein [Streptomyces]|uniref:Secreted protein n=2 Tax=Streptomyces TaxID=1883 RepID=A0ABV9IJW7_9ACTN
MVKPTGTTVTVLRLTHTGHVVGALTRAAPAPPPVVRQLTGAAFPLAVPGTSGLVLAMAGLLTAEELPAPPGFLTAPWQWYVDPAEAEPQLRPVSGVPPRVSPDSGSLRVGSTDDGGAPVLALVHPSAHWGAGTSPRFHVPAALDANGTALLGNGAVGAEDEFMVFVRGRPVSVTYHVEIG